MATTLKLRTDIKKLKGALSSKSLPAPIKAKLKAQLDKAQNELKAMQSGAKPRKVSTTKGTKTALTSLQKLVNKKKFSVYQGKGIDLKKDADQGALAVGRRVSKGIKGNQFGDAKSSKGNVYYEYRANRLDVKQPKGKQKYPKLEDGGMMAKGGKLEVGVYRVGKPTKIKPNFYEQKIVEIFDNGDISTASDYGRSLQDFKSQSYPIISVEQLNAQYKMAHGGKTQGYDDKEDERLGMEYGKISSKDLNSTRARRDDARFEERMAKGGEIKVGDSIRIKDGLSGKLMNIEGENLEVKKITEYPTFNGVTKFYHVEYDGYIYDVREDKIDYKRMAKGGITREGNHLMHFEPYFEKNVQVASIDEDSKIIRPSSGYFNPNKIGKKSIAWAKRNGYKFMQDGKEFEDGGMMNEPKYDSAGFSREDDKRIKIYSGNKGKLNEIFNEYKNQKNELRANEVFDNEKMKGKSVFLFVNDDFYDQYVQDEDEESYADENFGFAKGGYMAKGGKVEDELYVYEYQKGQWTVKDKKNPRAYYTLGSKRENAENARQAMIDKPSLLKYYRSNEYAQGGVTEKEVVESNAEMVLSKIKEVHHHADELGDIVSKKSDIEAWVVAKIERASTDLSDITHYLDGQHEKMSMGGSINNYVHKMDKK